MKRLASTLRYLTLVSMLLFTVASVVSPAAAGPSAPGAATTALSQTAADLCYDLDTTAPFLHLSAEELLALAGDPYNYSEEQIEQVADDCANLPSEVLEVEPLGDKIWICHATGSETNPYNYIPVSVAGVYNGHYDVQHQGGRDIIPEFTYNDQPYGPQGDQTALNEDCTPRVVEPDEYELDVDKYFCTVEEEAAPEIGVPGENCVAATDQLFTLSLDGFEYTTAELLAGVWLEAGTYDLFEGETFLGSIVVEELEGPVTVLNYVTVPDEDEVGQIAVFKTLCETIGQQDTCNGREDLLEGYTVNFFIYEGADDTGPLVGTVTVTLGENAGGGGNTGSGSQGRIVSGDLPLGTYTVCEEEVAYGPGGEEVPLQAFPRPDASGGGSTGGVNQRQFGEDCITVDLTPGVAELKFLDLIVEDEEEPGLARVIKFFCADEDITVPVVGDDDDYDNCELATAEQLANVNFLVYPFGDAEAAIDVDDAALLGAGVELPAGTHTLVETVDGVAYELADVTVAAGETAVILVINPVEVEKEITLNIYKFVCSGFSEKHEDGCVEDYQLDGTTIDFTVSYTIGEETTTLETSLEIEGSEGSATLTLPLADSYTVCEDVPEGVEEVLFSVGGVEDIEIDENGCITFSGDGFSSGDVIHVSFWNDMEDEKPVTPEEPKTPEKPVPPKKPIVTKLPSTGSGSAETGTNAPIFLIAAAVAAAGAAAILRKERMAA